MAEQIIQVDPSDGTAVGYVDRADAHREGIWHASVHVWILTADGDVVLQRRAPWKAHFPGMWDISAAGHVRAGEDPLEEVSQELGVRVEPTALEELGHQRLTTRTADYLCNEWARVWLWRSALQLGDLAFPDGEVTAAAALDPAAFGRLLDGTAVPARVWDGSTIVSSPLAPVELVPFTDPYRRMLLPALGA